MRAVISCIAIVATSACWSGPGRQGPGQQRSAPQLPLGLDLAAPIPDANPPSAAKIELGRTLFFDPVLSADGSMSCSSCHQPGRYFTDGRPRAVGIHDRVGARNVPSLFNVVYGRSFFWDGRAPSLEDQVLQPIQGENELGLELDVLVRRLATRERYRAAFAKAFGDSTIDPLRVSGAIAAYLRTLRSGNAPFDQFMYGDTTAMSADARKGFRLFVGRANCAVCHTAPLFTDHQFHNTGVSYGSADAGRFAVTGRPADRGAFKTPSLRNVAATPPYMHDGSLATLGDVIEHYDRGGTPNPYLDAEIQPLRLTAAEKRQLIAFLEALTADAETAAAFR